MKTPTRIALAFLFVALATAGCGAGPAGAWWSPALGGTVSADSDHVTISGTMDVTCTSGYGCGGYSDVSDGTQATLVDESGKTVAVTNLHQASPGSTTFTRSYVFTFVDVPKAQRYGFHAGNLNRGVIWASLNDARNNGFHLSLGS